MKAYVINQQQLGQSIAAAVVALIVSFSLGYFAGSATTENATENTAELVEPVAVDTQSAEKKTKVKVADSPKQVKQAAVSGDKNKSPGADRTKEKKSEIKSSSKTSSPAKPVVSTQQKAKESPKKATVVNQPVVKKSPSEKAASKMPEPEKPASPAVASRPDAKPDSSRETVSTDNKNIDDNASANRIYSIQAGMFASKNNAQSFVEKLSAEKFEAYVTDFVSSDGTIKYNVRVGRYEKRDIAREKLQQYQKLFSTPAYVVIAQ